MHRHWKGHAFVLATCAILATGSGCSSASDEPPPFETSARGDGADEDALSDDALGDLLMAEDDRDLDLDQGLDVGTEPADEPVGDASEGDENWSEEADPGEVWDDASPSASGSIVPLSNPLDGTPARATGRPKKLFGLGVDANVATASPFYPQLRDNWKTGAFHLGAARRVFYVEGIPAKEEAATDKWLAGLAGLEPTMGLSVHAFPWLGSPNSGRLTPHRTFRARFWRLLRKYPQVKSWGVTNEPDLEIPRGKDWAKEAASYFVDGAQVLRRCLRVKKCSRNVRLIAGEFSYQGDGKSRPVWEAFGEELLGRVKTKENKNGKLFALPRAWALHPYRDTTYGNTIGGRSFSAFVRRLENKAGDAPGSLRVWLTETGTLIALGSAEKPRCLSVVGDATAQRKGAAIVTNLAKLGRVDRIYWWQFQQSPDYNGGSWDSGMIDNDNKPRASFCALAGDAAGCDGDTYSKACPAGSPTTICTGRPDGTQCSPTAPFLGIECRGGALVRDLKCPPPGTRCQGATPDGTKLVCN